VIHSGHINPIGNCAECGIRDIVEMDHIKAEWKCKLEDEQWNVVENLQWLCRPCHNIKTTLEMSDWWVSPMGVAMKEQMRSPEGRAAASNRNRRR
jgi:hypothetical protein